MIVCISGIHPLMVLAVSPVSPPLIGFYGNYPERIPFSALTTLLSAHLNRYAAYICLTFWSDKEVAALGTVALCCKPSSEAGVVWVKTSLCLGQGHT